MIREGVKYKERYSDDELRTLLVEPKRTDIYPEWRTWLIISIMMSTGLRIGSICELKKSDIHDNIIYIRRTKNHNEQSLPLSPTLKMNILKYYSVYSVDSEYIFLSSKCGNILTPNSSYQYLVDYCKNRNTRCLGWHAFRHSFAYKCYTSGMDLITLQSYLQHSTPDLTRRYIGALGASDLRPCEVPLDSLVHKKYVKKI